MQKNHNSNDNLKRITSDEFVEVRIGSESSRSSDESFNKSNNKSLPSKLCCCFTFRKKKLSKLVYNE